MEKIDPVTRSWTVYDLDEATESLQRTPGSNGNQTVPTLQFFVRCLEAWGLLDGGKKTGMALAQKQSKKGMKKLNTVHLACFPRTF